MKQEGGAYTFVAWDDDDHVLVGNDDEARIVDATTHRELRHGYRDAVRIPGTGAARWAGSICKGASRIELLDAQGTIVGELVDDGAGGACIDTFAVSPDGLSLSAMFREGRAARWVLPLTPTGGEIQPVETTKLGSRQMTAATIVGGDLMLAGAGRKGFNVGAIATDGKVAREYDLPLPDEMLFPNPTPGPQMDHGNHWINDLAASPDGEVVVAAAGRYLYAWNIRTRTRIFRESSFDRASPNDHQAGGGLGSYYWHCHGYYCSLDFSGDGRLLAVGSQYGRIHLYEAKSRRWIGEFGASAPKSDQLLFAGDDTLVVRAGAAISVWSLRQARPLVTLEPTAWVTRLAVDNGRIVVFGPAADPRCGPGVGAIRYEIWNSLAPRAGTIDADPNRTIASRCGLVGNADAGDSLDDVLVSHSLATVTRYQKDPTNRTGISKRSRVVDVKTGREVALDPIAGEENHMIAGKRRRLSRDGRWAFDVVTAPIVPKIAVWDAATGKLLGQLGKTQSGSMLGTNTAFMSPSSDRIAVGSRTLVDIYSLPDLALVAADQPVSQLAQHGFGLGTVGHAHWMAAEENQRTATSSSGVVAKAADDGSIEVSDTRGLRARLVMFDDAEWEIVTPRGAYTGSFEVAARVGWTFSSPFEVFGSSQFASKFERPDLVVKRLAGDDVDVDAAARRPPRVRVTNAPAADGKAKLAIDVESVGQVDWVGVSVEGRLVEKRRVCARSARLAIDVPLLAGSNRITVIAFDTDGYASNQVSLDVAGTTDATRPTLWMLAIGVGEYPNLGQDEQLPGASADAPALTAAFERATADRRLFANTRSEVLTDRNASAQNVLAALDKLAAMEPSDVAIVMLSGHGVETASGQMVFLTTGASNDEASWSTHGVDWSAIRDRLAKVHGRVLLLLDACHSGAITRERVIQNDRFANELLEQGRTGVIVFAASKGAQLAYEQNRVKALRVVSRRPDGPRIESTLSRGLFAGAIIDALSDPAADLDVDGVLQLSDLVEFVTAAVDQQTAGYQTPWLVRREVFGDFALVSAARTK